MRAARCLPKSSSLVSEPVARAGAPQPHSVPERFAQSRNPARRGAGPADSRAESGLRPGTRSAGVLAEDALCDHAQFSLLDFNEETINHTSRVLEELKRRYGRRSLVQVQKQSVQHVLKDGARPVSAASDRRYNLIYCAGLFDYLPDRTCMQLMNIFYDWLLPGGLLAATNVEDCKPFRHMLEYVLDWHLIYRGMKQSAALLPQRAEAEHVRILKDPTEVNVFVEVRKPDHA